MGLGIPEAMLVSAAVGGASAAATGKDPLMGAVLGGAGSLVGPALGSALGEAAGTVLPAATDVGTTAATSQIPTIAAEEGVKSLTSTGLRSFDPASGLGDISLQQTPASSAPANIGVRSVSSTGLPSFDAPSNIGDVPVGPSGTRFAQDPFKFAMENKAPLISAAIAGQAAGPAYQPGVMSGPEDDPNNPLRRYRFDPNRYRPILRGYADGGIASVAPPGYDMVVGEPRMYADGGGISDLGTYSDGGRMLKGRGDGMSDSIPGVIGGKRPARLADGEFVVPADVVSHLGNGSTDAGAKQLYKMMDKVRAARTGTRKQGRQINPRRFMPA